MNLVKVITFAIRQGARVNEIHERYSVNYFVEKTVAVFTGVALEIGLLERERERVCE